MSVAEFIRWDARCRSMPAHGVTAGDTYYLGLRDYVEPYPCPNGLPIDTREICEIPAWNDRINKAKRDIEKHKAEQRVQLLAESISDDQILTEIEVIRQWSRSLQQTRSQTGSRGLTKAGTN